MRRILTFAVCFVLFAALAPAVRADVVTEFWQGVLDAGYSPGDKIRVVFVTSPVVDAFGANQAYYDTFGDGRASAGAVTGSLGNIEWRPLVSTVSDGTITTPGQPVKDWLDAYNIPVFNTKGQLVKSLSSNMLSQSLDTAIKYDESADNQAPQGSVTVWTGTNSSGAGDKISLGPYVFDLRLGNDDLPAGGAISYSTIGDGGATSGWLKSNMVPQATMQLGSTGTVPVLRSIYVMSGELTVVPEPATLAMWIGLGGIAGLVFWRKRRKSS